MGRVEVWMHGEWGTVCDDHIDTNNNGPRVICRMLGKTGGRKIARSADAKLDVPVDGPIWLDDVKCSGSESSIFDCSHIQHNGNCGHREDFYVQCS